MEWTQRFVCNADMINFFFCFTVFSALVMSQISALLFVVQQHQTSPTHEKIVPALRTIEPNFFGRQGM